VFAQDELLVFDGESRDGFGGIAIDGEGND